MNFQDKYDVRNYLDGIVGMDILTNWLMENPDKAAEYGIEEDG